MRKKIHVGSAFEDFLAEEGILEETETIAIKRMIAWQVKRAGKKIHISHAEMIWERQGDNQPKD